ncbi:ribosomal subunit interface protein [Endomicrobiia bacterium]|nr:ribosomal subunit interface protein [Endomicrobiia bacterium]
MYINISTRHLKLTDAIDSYVRNKITKYGKFHDGDDVWVHVILSIGKNRQIREIIFNVEKLSFISKDESVDLYASIDLATDKLAKQLKNKNIFQKFTEKTI